jgi:hypothetical protein
MPQTKPKAKRERRRSRRQQSAWIVSSVDHAARECELMDLSLHGAKIVVDVDAEIGCRFRLSLVPFSTEGKPCEVIWRRGKTLGIKFVP